MRQVPEDFPQPSERETNGMLPKPVLHKRNGHRYPRRPGIRFASEMLGLVHHDSDRATELSPDLVRFGAIVQSERVDEQWEQMLARGMSLPSALARALTRTREAFERGELADLQVALEGLRAQASAAAEMIAGLTNASRPLLWRRHYHTRLGSAQDLTGSCVEPTELKISCGGRACQTNVSSLN